MRLDDKRISMKCKNGIWTAKTKEKGTKDRSGRNAAICEDDSSLAPGFCSAEEGHCLQYTDDGAKMDKNCPGTCGKTTHVCNKPYLITLLQDLVILAGARTLQNITPIVHTGPSSVTLQGKNRFSAKV